MLRGLEYLCSAGVTPDNRLSEAFDLVAWKRDSGGRWQSETRYPGRMPVEIDEGVGQPSRWITPRAESVGLVWGTRMRQMRLCATAEPKRSLAKKL